MDDLLREFLTETSESIATLDVEIVRLEKNPNDKELLSSIFRLVHTVKGTCGFLGLPRLEHVAHAAENVLGKFRDGELVVNGLAVSLILQSLDCIKTILAYLEQHEKEPEGKDDALIAALNDMAEGKMGADEFGFVPVPAAQTAKVADEVKAASAAAPAAPAPQAAPVEKPAEAAAPAAAPAVAKAADVQKAAADKGGSTVADQSIRVDVGLLENLMTTVSELVLTRNQLLQILRGQKDSAFGVPLQRLNQVTAELQEGVMKTRMQPIGNAWAKLPRIIRDLSLELGKKIDLQMVGAETELDRQVLELIKDPLTHMVRNSADHGIELPADRLKAGKPEMGVVGLNAYHEGGHIIIQISDDGRGLALDKIKSKILEKNLATADELASMSDQSIMQYIFKPGFSTAAQVTSVSGRGVGMDVVKTNIEKIGGTVDFQSVQGKGSRFFIKIPLTLAIVSALIVEVASERFVIPQIGVVELVKVSKTGEHKVEMINNAPVLRLRNRLLPLVVLRNVLGLKKSGDTPSYVDAFVVVAQAGSTTFGIVVDRVFDTEEIVVKPVSPILRDIKLFSGNTILGDGSVVMIIDLNGVAEVAGEGHAEGAASQTVSHAEFKLQEGVQSLLLFRAGGGAPKAVPLSLVARLEEVDAKAIEYSNGSPVVQYRGHLMPLIAVEQSQTVRTEGRQQVIVFADDDRNMGLLVDEIIDVIDDKLNSDLSVRRPGFLGTAIVAGKATDVLDVAHYLAIAFKDWFGPTGDATAYGQKRGSRVLLVDDSQFFRNLLVPLLTVSGYDVTAASSPAEALKMQEDGRDFDLIISDIEMPGMSGFDFVESIRGGGRWSGLPMIALSSHTAPRDLERSKQKGFTDHVPKFDRELLLATIQKNIVSEGADQNTGGRA